MSQEAVFPAKQVARMLGVHRQTVNRLARHRLLGCYRHCKDREVLISRDHLLEFSATHPQYFGGRPYENLMRLLDDEKLCSKLAQLPRREPNNGKPVRHVESGTIYASGRAAARAHFISPDSVCYCCRGYNATTQAGRFEYVYPD